MTPVLFISTNTLEQLLHGQKNRSLRNEKHNANGASETEEQRKERLRIRCEKIEQEGELKKIQEEKK